MYTVAELIEIFDDEYDKLLSELLDETPNIDLWFPSGPYEAEVDIERRRLKGHEQIAGHVAWHLAHPREQPCILPGYGPAVEVPYTTLFGNVWVKLRIDVILGTTVTEPPAAYSPDTALEVRDWKSGNSKPKTIQLDVYSIAVQRSEMLDYLPRGDFYLATKGRPTMRHTPAPNVEDIVTKAFVSLDDNIRAGDFPPDPSPEKCRMCSVSYSCKYAV